MVAYSVKDRFEAPIRAGIKPHTMRNERKRHARPGEEIQIYYAMRTKHCRLIGRATCLAVTPVRIDFKRNTVSIGERPVIRTKDWLDKFAVSDGFRDWAELREFWRVEHGIKLAPGYPRQMPNSWSGVLIEWIDFKPAKELKA